MYIYVYVFVHLCVFYLKSKSIRENSTEFGCGRYRWACISRLRLSHARPFLGPSFCFSESFSAFPGRSGFCSLISIICSWFKRATTSPASIRLCNFRTHHSLISYILCSQIKFSLRRKKISFFWWWVAAGFAGPKSGVYPHIHKSWAHGPLAT